MRAFEIFLNSKKLCLVGVGDDGVLSAIVSWVTGKGRADLSLEVGGLISPARKHVKWIDQPLRLGDAIQVRIVEASSADKPIKKHRIDPALELRSKKSYVRMIAKQLGWKIQSRPKRRSS